jgi:putative FmdB family regulatory protein
MPLYEYKCKKCGHRFEKIQKFSDRMVKKCPECGGVVEQMISAPAVQFKGSGWYVTDYASKPGASDSNSSESKDAKAKADESKDSPKETSPKSETKETAKSSSSKESSSKKSGKNK